MSDSCAWIVLLELFDEAPRIINADIRLVTGASYESNFDQKSVMHPKAAGLRTTPTKVAIPQTREDQSPMKQAIFMKKNTGGSTAQMCARESLSRRAFLTKAPLVGATALSPLSALANAARDDADDDHGHLKESDKSHTYRGRNR
jgi:hypothetical protein